VVGISAVLMFSMILGIYKLAHRPVAPIVKQLVVAQPVVVAPASAVVAPSPVVVPEGEKKVQGVKQSSRVRTLAETTGGPAVVGLAVLPWGEVYLDGKLQGVSPPLLELQVVAGTHKMEIKNSSFPVYVEIIKAKPGEKIKIKHSFK
jgi:serine/threonine-protein kinase